MAAEKEEQEEEGWLHILNNHKVAKPAESPQTRTQ